MTRKYIQERLPRHGERSGKPAGTVHKNAAPYGGLVTVRQRILIVEDNADLRRLYAIGLNQRGYEVRLAANGAEAVDRVETEKPGAIVLDLRMPVMDGWEFIDRVNPPENQSPIPVLVVSGYPKDDDHPLPPCVHGWLAKPATIEELAEKLSEMLPLRTAC